MLFLKKRYKKLAISVLAIFSFFLHTKPPKTEFLSAVLHFQYNNEEQWEK